MTDTALPTLTDAVATDSFALAFQHTLWLWLLPLLLAAAIGLLLLAQRGRERALQNFAARRLLGPLLESLSAPRRLFKGLLVVLAIAAIVIALARPQYGFRWVETKGRGIDVVFVMDTSKSMLATDIKPDRLQRAKLAVLDFVEKLSGDRIGLVAFAGDAFVQCPPTLDYMAFAQALEALDTNTISVGGTDFAKAIRTAQTAFAADNSHKIMILITDGEDLEGEGLKQAEQAAKDGVIIYTVGVGTAEGSLIPLSDRYGRSDFVRDESGQQVLSKLEADTLEKIAAATHGFYVPLGSTGEGLETVYEKGLSSIPRQELSSRMQREGIDVFFWPLAAALLLLAWEPLISNRKKGYLRKIRLFGKARRANTASNSTLAVSLAGVWLGLALFTLGALTAAPAQADSPRKAQALYRKGQFDKAEETLLGLAATAPQDAQLRYNLGNAQYAQGKYDEALKSYAAAIPHADLKTQADIFYNMGLGNYNLGAERFAQSGLEQAQSADEEARATIPAAIRSAQSVLNEARRLAASAPRSPQQHQPQAAAPALSGSQPPAAAAPAEVPQERVKQALEQTQQAKQAADKAAELGENFVQTSPQALSFWQKALTDFDNAIELDGTTAADARHNETQLQQTLAALRARRLERERAVTARKADAAQLEKLIEELKKLIKEPPQQDQNQNQQNQQNDQNQQNQQNQNSQNNDQQQNQQQDQQNQQNQSGGQSGQQSDSQNDHQNQSGDNQQQADQQQNPGKDNQPNQSEQPNKPENPEKNSSDQQNSDSPADSADKNNNKDKGKNENKNTADKDAGDKNADGKNGENENDKNDRQQESGNRDAQQDGAERPEEKQSGQSQQSQPQSPQTSQQQQQQPTQSQPSGAGDKQPPQESAAGGEQQQQAPVDLNAEQAAQLAGEGEQKAGESAGQAQAGARQALPAGAMSRQEAQGLFESLRGSGRLLHLPSQGQQQQHTRPRKDW